MTIKIEKTLSKKEVIEIHDMILAESIGLPGFCESRSLVSALHRIDNHMMRKLKIPSLRLLKRKLERKILRCG